MEVASSIFSADFIYAVFRISTPILYATLAAYIAKKAGLLNIGIEGMMLFGAFAGVVISFWIQNIWLTFVIVALIGACLGLLLGVISMKLKSDIVLSGIALNIIAGGLTVFLLYNLTGDKGGSTSLASLTMPQVELPLIMDIPVLGQILSSHNFLTYFVFICAGILYVLIYKTKTGLRMRGVGENELAASSVGIHVTKMRMTALAVSGLLAAIGGMYLSTGYLSFFTTNMTAGRGFIGFAANAMSGGSILGGTLISMFFGLADALANALQSKVDIPIEFIYMIPYLAVVAALVIYNISRNRRLRRKRIKINE